ncbi:MAG: hypothetical protein EOO24_46530, partial [Comamonadaceae bacterium]
MNLHPSRAVLGIALLAALATAAGVAQAQEATGRVISSVPLRESTGQTAYSVTYEYGGRQYTTRMDSPPGRTIALQSSAYGVTTSPVPEQPQIVDNGPVGGPGAQNGGGSPWDNVVPEPGVVVGAGAPPAPVYYGAPPPVAYPQPIYV